MNKIEKLVHSALIGATITTVAFMGLLRSRYREPIIPQSVLTGSVLRIQDIDWHKAPITLVLQISSTCHYCIDSMPLYKRLDDLRRRHARPIPLLVVSHDSETAIREALGHYHIAADGFVRTTEAPVLIPDVTPVLLVVDSHGEVKRSFVGMLDLPAQEDLIAIVHRGGI